MLWAILSEHECSSRNHWNAVGDSSLVKCFESRMAEDATNTEEWGPTTKTMAAISDNSKNYDDYVRIVQVLRGR